MRTMRAMMVAATVSLAACSDVFGPWDLTGVYSLTTVNEHGVPAVVFSRVGSDAFDVSLLSGVLRLRDDDTFTLQLDYVERDSHSDIFYSESFSGEWSTDDDFVRLEFVDPETGDWRSFGGFRRARGVEVTLPVADYGVHVRTVFER